MGPLNPKSSGFHSCSAIYLVCYGMGFFFFFIGYYEAVFSFLQIGIWVKKGIELLKWL